MVTVGTRAPDFELKDEEGKKVRLSDYNGRPVLIAFFPFAFSPVCTAEMCSFRDELDKFSEAGVQIIGISVDSTWGLKAWKEKLGLSFPLLSDFSKDLARRYGVLRAEGFADRSYFLVGADGMVKYKQIMPNPGMKLENEKIFSNIEKLWMGI